MAGNPQPAILKLTVSPFARRGDKIEAHVDAVNVSETTLALDAPDTVVISQPHSERVGRGTFQRTIFWLVEHAQPGTSTLVEITASAGAITQIGQCKIIG